MNKIYSSTVDIPSWQQLLQEAVTCPKELMSLLELNEQQVAELPAELLNFKLKVPRGFIERMQKNNPLDPLFMQVFPFAQEALVTAGYQNDPLSESSFNPIPGLLHKYANRVLLTVVGSCAINCRFCFRRHFDYPENNPGRTGWPPILEYIRQRPAINEVILSGGDPLIANDGLLSELYQALSQIPHIQTLRIHSRIPIVLPERITSEFLNWFTQGRLQPVLVTHCNHPQEIDTHVTQAIKKLRDTNVTLLNQTVLLKSINDDANTLIKLSHELFKIGILPYYLHLLDKVQGTAHFDVNLETAKAIYAEMMKKLSGYLLPKLVQERPGESSKTLLS